MSDDDLGVSREGPNLDLVVELRLLARVADETVGGIVVGSGQSFSDAADEIEELRKRLATEGMLLDDMADALRSVEDFVSANEGACGDGHWMVPAALAVWENFRNQ